MLTAETLWLQTVNYVRNALDPDVDMKILNDVAAKVYEQMKFLVQPTLETALMRKCNRCGKPVQCNDAKMLSATVVYCSLDCAD